MKNKKGKTSKSNLDNNIIRLKSNLKQWKNTYVVLNWFKILNNKSTSRFIKFDIVSFYPSISATILENFKFAAGLVEITEYEKELIRHCCKTVLFHEGETWSKKA